MKKINKIVIVGGGTSGWATATLLAERVPPNSNTEIVLVESPDIPIIGVGESTTGQMASLIKNTSYLNEEEFLRETGSTFKYGIRHTDWKVVGDFFNSPLVPSWYNETRFPHESYDFLRLFHIAENLSIDNFYHSQCMNTSKVFYVEGDPETRYPDVIPKSGRGLLDSTGYAYHMDAYKTSDFLRKKTIATGRVKRLEATVASVKRGDNGHVQELILQDGSSIGADFFIDCSGFKRLLKAEDNRFISYADQLLVDTAIIIPKEYEDENVPVKTYTNAKAMKNGWMFEIPLQHRVGRGYNFSSKHTTQDQAHEELERSLNEKVEVKNVIKFEPGRLERFWDRNVLHVGIASGFMEPLEATTIHISLKEVEHFMEEYYSGSLDISNPALQKRFNFSMASLYDENRDFLVFHYHNTRQDTQFWKDSSSEKVLSENLKNNLAMWESRSPRLSDFLNPGLENNLTLGTVLYYNILIGMRGLSPKLAKRELDYYGLKDLGRKTYQSIKEFGDYAIKRSLDSNSFYKLLREKRL